MFGKCLLDAQATSEDRFSPPGVHSTWQSPPLLCLPHIWFCYQCLTPLLPSADSGFLQPGTALFLEEASWPSPVPGLQSVPRKCLMNPGPSDSAFRDCKIRNLTFLPEKCRYEGRGPIRKRRWQFHSVFPVWRGTVTVFGQLND